MKTTGRPTRTKPRDDWETVNYLYQKILHWFYERADRRRARMFADRLEDQLRRMGNPRSIFAEECQSLIAEVKGDLHQAIRHRLCEIERMRQLFQGSPAPARKDQIGYDASDLSDRLDLLAALYYEAGDLDRAVETLLESQRLCGDCGISFDGQEMLDDYRRLREDLAATAGEASSN